MKKNYPRDMIGYGSKTPIIKWPNGAKIALQIVLNYEEGAENCVLHGDKMSEVFLSEIIGAQPIKGRHVNMESFYEYGSKRGFWRLHELFQKKKIPSESPDTPQRVHRPPPKGVSCNLQYIEDGNHWF